LHLARGQCTASGAGSEREFRFCDGSDTPKFSRRPQSGRSTVDPEEPECSADFNRATGICTADHRQQGFDLTTVRASPRTRAGIMINQAEEVTEHNSRPVRSISDTWPCLQIGSVWP